MGAIVLLGPQRLHRTLAPAMAEAGVSRKAPVAVVTAGWREREDEVEQMRHHLDRPVVALRLYARSEEAMAGDLELTISHRERLAMILQQHELYRLRLAHAMSAARELLSREGDSELLEPARESAIQEVRALDAWHLERLAEIRLTLRERWRVEERPSVLAQRESLARALEPCESVAIAGGDVGALRNRLLLFDVAGLLGDRPVFAWSAGAMAVSERVVLFHDTPPHGAGDPEVLGDGLGLVRGVLAFPHAQRRLRLDDRVRVELMARRFAPLRCLAMDEGSQWFVLPGAPLRGPATRILEADGSVRPVGSS